MKRKLPWQIPYLVVLAVMMIGSNVYHEYSGRVNFTEVGRDFSGKYTIYSHLGKAVVLTRDNREYFETAPGEEALLDGGRSTHLSGHTLWFDENRYQPETNQGLVDCCEVTTTRDGVWSVWIGRPGPNGDVVRRTVELVQFRLQ